MKKFGLISLLCSFSLSLVAQERYGPYKVSKFVDGDTFWVRVNPEKDLKVRLIGVDTPEVKWEGLTEERPGGKETSEYVKDLLKGKKYYWSTMSRNTIPMEELLHMSPSRIVPF